MLRRTLSVLLPVMVYAAPTAPTPSVDEIIQKHIEAQGGLAKLKAIKTMKMNAIAQAGPMTIPMTMEFKRPGSVRVEVSVQGMTMIQAFDGTKGWKTNPLAGSSEAEAMSPEEVQIMEVQKDWEGPLVEYKTKGHRVDYMGKERVENATTHKLKVTLKRGDVMTLFLDTNTYLTLKMQIKRQIRGTEMESETLMSDYKKVGGTMMPHTIENSLQGVDMRQKITIQNVELNTPIEDARFKMPTAPTPTVQP